MVFSSAHHIDASGAAHPKIPDTLPRMSNEADRYEAKREPLGTLAAGLPGPWYHDAAQYRRELDAIWMKRWLAVLRSEELALPLSYRVVEVGTQQVVIVRREDGSLAAFHNTCRHRGSILCTEQQGRLHRDRLICPYHLWSYDLDGKLVATPRRMPTPDFDEKNFSLYEVAVDTWGGFVFIHFAGASAPPLRDELGPLPARFARYPLEELRIGKRIVLDIQANWKILVENFSECLHCPAVHPELCKVVTAYRDAGAWGLHRDAEGRKLPESRPEYKAGAKTLTLDGSARIPPFAGLSEAERATPYIPEIQLPGLFLNVHPDYVNSHLMLPTGPESVRIVYDWLFEPAGLQHPDFDLEHYVALWELVNAQDARNCEWQQQGIRSQRFEHGYYVPQEFDCQIFADWVRAALDGPAPPLTADW